MTYDLKLEKELVKLKFKKKYLSDTSGYWFEKDFKIANDIKAKYIVETDRKIFVLQLQTGSYKSNRITNLEYNDNKCFKCDLKTIKSVIKKYK